LRHPLATVERVKGLEVFFEVFSDTKLARQLQQECTQVVCSNKFWEIRKRLTKSNNFTQT